MVLVIKPLSKDKYFDNQLSVIETQIKHKLIHSFFSLEIHTQNAYTRFSKNHFLKSRGHNKYLRIKLNYNI